MDQLKATLPDVIQSRVEDLLHAQLSDEEQTARLRESWTRMESFLALLPEELREEASAILADFTELADRTRRDFVDMAYRQGLRDGSQIRELTRDVPDA